MILRTPDIHPTVNGSGHPYISYSVHQDLRRLGSRREESRDEVKLRLDELIGIVEQLVAPRLDTDAERLAAEIAS
jgi:hypothetical protein